MAVRIIDAFTTPLHRYRVAFSWFPALLHRCIPTWPFSTRRLAYCTVPSAVLHTQPPILYPKTTSEQINNSRKEDTQQTTRLAATSAMSLESFALFPLLPVEIRFLIWEFSFTPRVLTFRIQGYGKDEDPSAVPAYIIFRARRPDPNREVHRRIWSGRCIPVQVPSQDIFQVSQEPRRLAFTLGYQRLRLQKSGSLARQFIWNPAKDFIFFQPLSSRRASGHDLGIPLFYWPRVFAVQYPREASRVQNIAFSTAFWYRPLSEGAWIFVSLSKYTSLSHLVVVVDEEHERAKVKALMEPSFPNPSRGPWKIPQDMHRAFNTSRDHQPDINIPTPDIRIVADASGILSSQSLEITLRCSPCPYLRMGYESSGAQAPRETD